MENSGTKVCIVKGTGHLCYVPGQKTVRSTHEYEWMVGWLVGMGL